MGVKYCWKCQCCGRGDSLVTKFLRNNKKILQIIYALLALICISFIISARAEFIPFRWFESRSRFVLFAIPFFSFGAVHLLLMYENWFRSKSDTIIGQFKQLFFGLLAIAYFIVLIGFIFIFLLNA